MKTQEGHVYAHIQHSRVSWIFTQSDLPEFNENDIEVVDITSLSPVPEVGYHYSAGMFSTPAMASPDELAALERVWRDGQLAGNQWLTARHRDELDLGDTPTLTAAQFSELLTYRKALRDWPQGDLFPLAERRPVAPLWLDEQMQ
ncbi:phage tail assembly chaperone [Pseudomonas mohnii]